MLEIAQRLEQLAAGLSPAVLVAVGLSCIIAGLFVWLGGLGFQKALVAVIGAVIGGFYGFFMIGRGTTSALILAGGAGALAIIFEQIFITIMAAGLAAACGFAVLADFCEVDLSAGFGAAWSKMPDYGLVIVIVLAAVFAAGGIYFRRLTSAVCCAAFGTLLAFAGMILLLLYKDAAPISKIENRVSFYAAVLAAMTAFGTIEQLLLCEGIKKRLTKKGEAKKQDQTSDTPRRHWRNR